MRLTNLETVAALAKRRTELLNARGVLVKARVTSVSSAIGIASFDFLPAIIDMGKLRGWMLHHLDTQIDAVEADLRQYGVIIDEGLRNGDAAA